MTASIKCISSMATRLVLAELSEAWRERSGCAVEIQSVGGVDAARRVQAGEAFDAVFLAADAIDKLITSGHVLQGSRVDLFESGVAVAVRVGEPWPDIGSEDALKRAVLSASRVGYSTGPSGLALTKLFERWGIAAVVKDKIVQAPAGIPVGALLARGEIGLAFQQFSELMHLPGIEIVGPMPDAVRIDTTFSGGVCSGSLQPEAARQFLAQLASPETADAKRHHGMHPARKAQ
ncbi:MAG: substrate-binding domain-containing protein [Ramlibacter sp.]